MTGKEYAAQKRRDRQRRYYQEHREEKLAYRKKYVEEHRESVREYNRQYQAEYRQGIRRRGEDTEEK